MRRTLIVVAAIAGFIALPFVGSANAESPGCALQRKLGIKNVMACDWNQG